LAEISRIRQHRDMEADRDAKIVAGMQRVCEGSSLWKIARKPMK